VPTATEFLVTGRKIPLVQLAHVGYNSQAMTLPASGQIKAATIMPPILITEISGEDIHHKAIKWHYAKEVELQGNVHMEAAMELRLEKRSLVATSPTVLLMVVLSPVTSVAKKLN